MRSEQDSACQLQLGVLLLLVAGGTSEYVESSRQLWPACPPHCSEAAPNNLRGCLWVVCCNALTCARAETCMFAAGGSGKKLRPKIH